MEQTADELVAFFSQSYTNVDPRIIHVAVQRFGHDPLAVTDFIEKVIGLSQRLPQGQSLNELLDDLELNGQLRDLDDWLAALCVEDNTSAAPPVPPPQAPPHRNGDLPPWLEDEGMQRELSVLPEGFDSPSISVSSVDLSNRGDVTAGLRRLEEENNELRGYLTNAETTVKSLVEEMTALRAELRVSRENLSSQDTSIVALNDEIMKLQLEKGVLQSELTAAALQREQQSSELEMARAELKLAQNQVETVERLAQMLERERVEVDVTLARTVTNADDLKSQMEANRLRFEEEKGQLQQEMSVRNRQLQERVSAPLLKACMLDHIMEQGNVQLPNDCQISDINPCLTTGWAFSAFTSACVSEGFSSVTDAIQKGGVTVGFHGTPKAEHATVIFCDGFDPSKRARQVYGPGEYFDQDMGTCFSYAKGCVVIVALILKTAPKPGPEHKETPKNWRIVTNPPKASGLTYCFPVMALRQQKAGEPRKFTIPPCKKCRSRNASVLGK